MRRRLAVPALCASLAGAGCLWISAEEHALRLDGDGDGALADVDCNDADPAVSPRLPEVPCDAVDNDCRPATPDGPAYVERGQDAATFATVQEALDAAVPPERVVVCGTTVREQVVVGQPGLMLMGRPGAVLDGTGAEGPVVRVAAPDVTIADLAVTGGSGLEAAPPGAPPGRYGGGVNAMEAGGRLTLRQVTVSGAGADRGAGVAGLDLALEGCTVSGNTAVGGGGLWVGAAATLVGTAIRENTAEDGGGIELGPGATATLDDATVVAANQATRGAGVRVGPEATLTGGVVEGNVAGDLGGGVWLEGGRVSAVQVRDNQARRGGGIAGWGHLDGVVVTGNAADEGGGVWVDGDLSATVGLFSANIATVAGGGVLVAAGRFAVDDDPARIERPRFLANRADGGWGGGIAVVGGSEIEIVRTDLVDNHAAWGGAVAIRDDAPCTPCVVRITETVIEANGATSEGGGVWSNREVFLDESTLAGNTSGGAGGALFLAVGGNLDRVALDVNTAETDGGGALVASGDLLVDASSLTGNTALGRGAAIMVRPEDGATAAVVVSDSELRANGAVSSAAVALTPADATLHVQSGTLWAQNTDYDIEVGGDGCFAVAPTFVCTDGACPEGCEP